MMALTSPITVDIINNYKEVNFMKKASYEYVINYFLDDMSRVYQKYGEISDVAREFLNILLSEYEGACV